MVIFVLMQTFPYIIAASVVPALVAQVQAVDRAGVMEEYFPTSDEMKLRVGAVVRIAYDDSLQKPVGKINENINKLPPEQGKAFKEEFDAGRCPEYNPVIWPNRVDYEEFVDAWNKSRVVPVTQVLMGLQKTPEGTWRVLSVMVDARTRGQIPLTLSALRYDAEKNEWISNDGILKPQEYAEPASGIYGAQKGTEWILEKETSLTMLRVTLRVSRTTDRKYVYLRYAFNERLKADPDTSIVNENYMLRFGNTEPGADVGKPGQR